MSLDGFWCEKRVAAKRIHAPIILTRLRLARRGITRFWKRHEQQEP